DFPPLGLRRTVGGARDDPPAMTCRECRCKITSGNRTGLCKRCYNRGTMREKRAATVSYVCSTPDCERVLPRRCPTGLCKGCYQLRYRKKLVTSHFAEIEEPKITHDPFLAKLEELHAL